MSDKPTVVEALTAVMDGVQAVKKADRNNEQHYSFRGIDAVVNAVGPELRKHGVIVVPLVEESSFRDVLTTREKRSRECTVRVRYRFYGPAGDFIDAVTPGESMDFGDKGAAKAMSVAFRIALLQALCIPTDEPDADSHTYERSAEWENAKPAQPSASAAVLFEQITAATKPDELRDLWQAVNKAGATGEIAGTEAAQLKSHITKRGEEIGPGEGEPT